MGRHHIADPLRPEGGKVHHERLDRHIGQLVTPPRKLGHVKRCFFAQHADLMAPQRSALLHCDRASGVGDRSSGSGPSPFIREPPRRETLSAKIRHQVAEYQRLAGRSRGFGCRRGHRRARGFLGVPASRWLATFHRRAVPRLAARAGSGPFASADAPANSLPIPDGHVGGAAAGAGCDPLPPPPLSTSAASTSAAAVAAAATSVDAAATGEPPTLVALPADEPPGAKGLAGVTAEGGELLPTRGAAATTPATVSAVRPALAMTKLWYATKAFWLRERQRFAGWLESATT